MKERGKGRRDGRREGKRAVCGEELPLEIVK